MKIRVKFFAYTREIVGEKETEVEVPKGATLSGVMDVLTACFPALERYRKEINMAINHEYAEGDTVLHEGDEVALLPPVSGG